LQQGGSSRRSTLGGMGGIVVNVIQRGKSVKPR